MVGVIYWFYFGLKMTVTTFWLRNDRKETRGNKEKMDFQS